jgi:L-aspartate oxidase
VLGSGIAGLTYALDMAEHGSVAVVSKDVLQESNTQYAQARASPAAHAPADSAGVRRRQRAARCARRGAHRGPALRPPWPRVPTQGGICGVMDAHDSVESHIADTVVAGAFLCKLPAVEVRARGLAGMRRWQSPRPLTALVQVVCREGASAVRYLADLGARFSCDAATGDFHLAREGGHTHHRIVHAADATGREIERALVAAVRTHPRITVYERHLALDLVLAPGGEACLGTDTLDRSTGAPRRFLASTTMLATGGAGHAYPSTTNPAVATGDGMAMAHRAGASMANMEFVQFHPTALYAPDAAGAPPSGSAFLISEAVRGAGGRLFNGRNERFMPRYDGRAELAPRDVVARCIDAECKRLGEPCVWLDITHKPAAEVLTHFPNISAHCATLGIDITKQRIPVLPAAHYFCGGVVTDLNGQTSVSGLFAAGEVACTGLHGANRLASNSLLEGVVFSRRAAPAALLQSERAAVVHADALRAAAAAAPLTCTANPAGGSGTTAVLRSHLQASLWRGAGIVRTTAGIQAGLQEMQQLRVAAEALVRAPGAGALEHELRNLAAVGDMVLRCALQRKESRGLHYNTDFAVPVEAERRHSVIEDAAASARRSRSAAPEQRPRAFTYPSELGPRAASPARPVLVARASNAPR